MSRIENRAPGRTRIGLLPDKAGPRPAGLPVPVLAVTIVVSALAWAMVFTSGAHLLHFDA